jgi:hypothetical protein
MAYTGGNSLVDVTDDRDSGQSCAAVSRVTENRFEASSPRSISPAAERQRRCRERRRRGAMAVSMSAIDNMHSYAQIARAYADNTERLATAFDSLYASLTDTQKQAADTLFRQQAAVASQPRTRR